MLQAHSEGVIQELVDFKNYIAIATGEAEAELTRYIEVDERWLWSGWVKVVQVGNSAKSGYRWSYAKSGC